MSSRYYQTEHVSACSDCPCIWFKHGFQIDVLNLTCSRPFNTAAKMCPYNIGFWIKACVHKCSNQWRMCTNGKYFEWIFLFNCHTSLAVTLMLSLIRDTTHGPRITLQQLKSKIDFFFSLELAKMYFQNLLVYQKLRLASNHDGECKTDGLRVHSLSLEVIRNVKSI